jgi:hypothetical protein
LSSEKQTAQYERTTAHNFKNEKMKKSILCHIPTRPSALSTNQASSNKHIGCSTMMTNILIIVLTIAIHSSVAFSTTPITTGFLQVNVEGDTVPEGIVVPPFTLIGSMVDDEIINNIEIKYTDIPQKGYGAFAKGRIPRHSFLGFYLGPRFQNESLDDKMKERAEQITKMVEEGKYIYPMDYVISLDGGATFIDGFDR